MFYFPNPFILTLRYRSLNFILQSVGGQILGTTLATILLFICGLPMSKYLNTWENDEVFGIEFIYSIMLGIVYYVAILDIRVENENIYPFVIASFHATLAIAFPQFGGGNMLRLFAGLNSDVGFVLSSIAGQLLGITIGAVFYKFMLCDNKTIEEKEKAVNEHETKNMSL